MYFHSSDAEKSNGVSFYDMLFAVVLADDFINHAPCFNDFIGQISWTTKPQKLVGKIDRMSSV